MTIEPSSATESNAAPGLYLHAPFCSAVCPYCDFAVTTGGAERRRRFVDALVTEIGMGAPEGWGEIDTIYLGGGTPSLLDLADLERVLEAARAALPLAQDPWITMEANPEDVDAPRAAAWRRLGVRTLSLGVQSFGSAQLGLLGRRHGPDEAVASVETALAAGFATVSVDLMFALPGQAAGSWRRDLLRAASLRPQHVSCYQLTFHRGTPFGLRRARGEMEEMPDAAQARLFRLAHEVLKTAGLEAYEVSNFAAAPGHRSRHNTKYWNHVPYLGLGPSAHSFDGRRRWWNERALADWEARLARGERPVAGDEELTARELALERLMLGLRTTAGIDLDGFTARYGFDLETLNRDLIDAHAAAGRLEIRGGRLRPTPEGLAVADALARDFRLTEPVASPAGGRGCG